MNEEEKDMYINTNKSEKKPNPLIEAKKMLQKAMKENGRTAKDVKRDIDLSRYDD